MVRIKICGFTDVGDLRAACDAGIDAVGINLARGPRRVDLDQAVALCAATPVLVTRVLLFVDADRATIEAALDATGADAVQLHGDEPPELAAALRRRTRVIKAFRVADAAALDAVDGYPADAYLLDAHVAGLAGGTGTPWDHGLLAGRHFAQPVVLAGGLDPRTVAAAVSAVRPWAVDTASGVESTPARKDPRAVAAFVAAVRGA